MELNHLQSTVITWNQFKRIIALSFILLILLFGVACTLIVVVHLLIVAATMIIATVLRSNNQHLPSYEDLFLLLVLSSWLGYKHETETWKYIWKKQDWSVVVVILILLLYSFVVTAFIVKGLELLLR
jgi:hypothetical protein